MANYQLGPVIGKIGGGAEIITEQVEMEKNESLEWELPEGWETGYIGGQGIINGLSGGSRNITFFGQESTVFSSGETGYGGFGTLPSSIITENVTWSGTVTLIRTA